MSDMLARLAARAQESPVVLGRRIGYRFAPVADYQEAWPGEELVTDPAASPAHAGDPLAEALARPEAHRSPPVADAVVRHEAGSVDPAGPLEASDYVVRDTEAAPRPAAPAPPRARSPRQAAAAGPVAVAPTRTEPVAQREPAPVEQVPAIDSSAGQPSIDSTPAPALRPSRRRNEARGNPPRGSAGEDAQLGPPPAPAEAFDQQTLAIAPVSDLPSSNSENGTASALPPAPAPRRAEIGARTDPQAPISPAPALVAGASPGATSAPVVQRKAISATGPAAEARAAASLAGRPAGPQVMRATPASPLAAQPSTPASSRAPEARAPLSANRVPETQPSIEAAAPVPPPVSALLDSSPPQPLPARPNRRERGLEAMIPLTGIESQVEPATTTEPDRTSLPPAEGEVAQQPASPAAHKAALPETLTGRHETERPAPLASSMAPAPLSHARTEAVARTAETPAATRATASETAQPPFRPREIGIAGAPETPVIAAPAPITQRRATAVPAPKARTAPMAAAPMDLPGQASPTRLPQPAARSETALPAGAALQPSPIASPTASTQHAPTAPASPPTRPVSVAPTAATRLDTTPLEAAARAPAARPASPSSLRSGEPGIPPRTTAAHMPATGSLETRTARHNTAASAQPTPGRTTLTPLPPSAPRPVAAKVVPARTPAPEPKRAAQPSGDIRIDIGRIQIDLPRPRTPPARPQPPPLKAKPRGGPDA